MGDVTELRIPLTLRQDVALAIASTNRIPDGTVACSKKSMNDRTTFDK